ncbi:MAG: hypothetical protein ACR9NN_08595 [Nostochopsis sp.]
MMKKIIIIGGGIGGATSALALSRAESVRFPRTKAIIEQSLQSAKMGGLKNPVAVGLRNTFLKVMGSAISNSFKSLHAYRA